MQGPNPTSNGESAWLKAVFAALAVLCVAAASPPLPVLPKLPVRRVFSKAQSPRGAEQAASLTHSQPRTYVVTLSAVFYPLVHPVVYHDPNNGMRTNWVGSTNVTAWIEVRPFGQTNWTRVGERTCPTNGGTLYLLYTNVVNGNFFQRAGYTIH